METLKPNFKKRGGLVPVIAQDETTKEILMLAYADEKAYLRTRTHFNTHSKPRSERFSFSARRDKEAVVFPTATRSNEAMEEKRQNPSGGGPSAPDPAALLLDVAKATPASSAPCPDADWP